MQSNRETLLCHYLYDPLDRLTACTPSKEASTQRFYLKDRLATEVQGAVQRSIMQHDDQLLAQQERQSDTVETRLLATDQQRSVLNVIDATRTHFLAYIPYGHRPPENGLLSLLGFNGERPDPVTEHYLLGNGYRAFNPALMRFNSPDSWSPFGAGGVNAYAYCKGDPVNRSDPTGHVPPFFAKLFGASNAVNVPVTRPSLLSSTPLFPPTNTNSGFLKGIWTTTKQSLRRNSAPSIEPISSARHHVDQVVSNVADPQPFVQRLGSVNANLASHGNGTLTMEHALRYEQLVTKVSSGELSNTGAHAASASMWAEKYVTDRRPSGVVGVVFNGLGGTLLSGVQDHALQKTGKALRQ
ncbi:RHS repeat-associated core domain-containing protein [Pseudomonas sp. TH41]|uniref:RHS repeat-associated core domain-containing protein n=1 Tax=Pseudomonas sp. TH41 TaxID=2796405 RepID=UPI001F5BAF4C|nr:RHS repeat-associated core domain-containing protein [Pseudomonas sp. TH41]